MKEERSTEAQRETGYWLSVKWIAAWQKLHAAKMAALKLVVDPVDPATLRRKKSMRATPTKKQKTHVDDVAQTPREEGSAPSPLTHHVQPTIDSRFGFAAATSPGGVDAASAPSRGAAGSSSSFDAVAATAGAPEVVDLSAMAEVSAAPPAPAISLVTSNPRALNATLRCGCSQANRCGTRINKRNVCKISTELWERLVRAFGVDAFELSIMESAPNAPQQCETCKGGKDDLKREANDAKRRQEDACVGLDRVLYVHDSSSKRTSFKVQGPGNLRGGKVGPGEYAIVPVAWLSMWRLRMQNMGSAAFSAPAARLSYAPLYCSCEGEKLGLVKSHYLEREIMRGTPLPKMVFREKGSAGASPFEVRCWSALPSFRPSVLPSFFPTLRRDSVARAHARTPLDPTDH